MDSSGALSWCCATDSSQGPLGGIPLPLLSPSPLHTPLTPLPASKDSKRAGLLPVMTSGMLCPVLSLSGGGDQAQEAGGTTPRSQSSGGAGIRTRSL